MNPRNKDAIDPSAPSPQWPVARECLGDELLADLVGISQHALKRYALQSRPPAPVIAERLRWLRAVIEDLKGAYDSTGIRAWFKRPRQQLGGRSPRQALGESWSIDDEAAQRVRALAATLSDMPFRAT